MNRQQILEWTAETTRAAGARALTLLHAGEAKRVTHKEDDTLVTEIDRSIEQFLRERIGVQFPGHAILGEEYGLTNAANGTDGAAPTEPLWTLDPIDGTTNLANGLPHWGISVGLVEAGEPVVGVVAFPLLNELYAGARGLGARLNGSPLATLRSRGPMIGDDAYGICSNSIYRMRFDTLPAHLRLTGSAALDACWTASGSFRGSQSLGVKLYDVAAGFCIAHEVGARSVWLKTGEPWSATQMLAEFRRDDDLLLTAAPETLIFLREKLSLL